jgi:hypothetical protein
MGGHEVRERVAARNGCDGSMSGSGCGSGVAAATTFTGPTFVRSTLADGALGFDATLPTSLFTSLFTSTTVSALPADFAFDADFAARELDVR